MEGEGSSVPSSSCDDLVEIPKRSVSASDDNHSFGSSLLSSPCDDLVDNSETSASATDGACSFGMIQAQMEAIYNHPGRTPQVKRKRPCEDLVDDPSATTAASGSRAQASGVSFHMDSYIPTYPSPEIVHKWEENRFVVELRYPPPEPCQPELVLPKTCPLGTGITDPYYLALVAAGVKVKVVGKRWCVGINRF